MNDLRVIGDRETVLAFALGGVPGQVAESAQAARDSLQALLDEAAAEDLAAPRPRLVLITRGAAAGVRDLIDRLVLAAPGPLILEIPGFAERRPSSVRDEGGPAEP
ncbi:MAG TPA: V-type ATP synthase subunit F [Candidatus Bathyarchaeia archaeon]|nr:V-type ATP synthase subunit F [Candidatus Bathyarchaeia archaeon]